MDRVQSTDQVSARNRPLVLAYLAWSPKCRKWPGWTI